MSYSPMKNKNHMHSSLDNLCNYNNISDSAFNTHIVHYRENNIFSSLKDRGALCMERRNVYVCGRRTSIRLERAWWDILEEICRMCGKSIHNIITLIDGQRDKKTSLTGVLRVYLMEERAYFLEKSSKISTRYSYPSSLSRNSLARLKYEPL